MFLHSFLKLVSLLQQVGISSGSAENAPITAVAMHEHDAPRQLVAQPDESEQRCPAVRVLWVRAVADCLNPILVWCANLELQVERLDSLLIGEICERGPVVHVHLE